MELGRREDRVVEADGADGCALCGSLETATSAAAAVSTAVSREQIIVHGRGRCQRTDHIPARPRRHVSPPESKEAARQLGDGVCILRWAYDPRRPAGSTKPKATIQRTLTGLPRHAKGWPVRACLCRTRRRVANGRLPRERRARNRRRAWSCYAQCHRPKADASVARAKAIPPASTCTAPAGAQTEQSPVLEKRRGGRMEGVAAAEATTQKRGRVIHSGVFRRLGG